MSSSTRPRSGLKAVGRLGDPPLRARRTLWGSMSSSTRPRSGLTADGRLGDPPLQMRWNFVGVDVLIDPSAKRPDGRRAARRSAPTGAVEHCGAPRRGAHCASDAHKRTANGRPYGSVRSRTIPECPNAPGGFSAPGAPEWRRPKTRPWTCSARRRRCPP